ncbi:FxsA family protein [Nocardioides panacisoli]|uniref:FxsA family protein n=1 Tax=Nocardioides panacisoli TaxID=627624 RepID=A0ABP7IQC3_9ACTN
MSRRRGRRWLAILAIAFIVVPLLEIYVLIQVGHVIGVWWTILLLVADSILGGWLIRREGSRAWQALRAALDEGRMPHRELADGALIVLGGALMLSPGFVTDLFGIVLILPFTRPVFRRVLASYAASRATVYATDRFGRPFPAQGARTQRRPGPTAGDDSVVRGEVIDDQR